MRALVARRREAGSTLEVPIPFGDTPAPFELLVVEVTDHGKRRPTRIARLVPPGARVAIAELIAPKLTWLKNWDFVLTGTDERASDKVVTGFGQSWLCKLAPPPHAVGFLARHTHKNGVELPRRVQLDRYASESKGQLSVASVHDPALGRHTTRAEIARDGGANWMSSLVDMELMWMAEERFALSGFDCRPASGEQPAQMLRHGWMCEYLIDEPEVEGRRYRKDGGQR
jgi:hypothetical protein